MGNMQNDLTLEKMIDEIEQRKDFVLNNCRILRPKRINRKDYYFDEIFKLAKKDYFFETWMVINWIGSRFRPKNILKIGTRNGGSLIALLSAYQDFSNTEVVCFDSWEEVGSPRRVKKNLNHLNIPADFVRFVSGDSKFTVPQYFKAHPSKEFDYILVDGGHDRETASSDLRNIEEHVAKSGVVIFDDISPESYNLKDVWDEFRLRNGDKFNYYEVMHRKGVAWAFKK